MTDQDPAISLEINDGIAVATMRRPKQRNAMSPEFIACIQDIMAKVRNDDSVRVFILTGSDGVFCAGGDIKGMLDRAKGKGMSADAVRKRLYYMNEWVQQLRTMEIPVIAAVDGPAFGAGFGLSLCADFVLASDRASFCSVFCRIGAVPDCGVLFNLPRMIGMQRAKQLMYTGREVSAEEARDLGIVMDIHPADKLQDATMELARQMKEASPTAFAITKRVTNQAFDNDANGILEMEAAGQAICLSSDYHKDAVDRFVAKKPLKFMWQA